MSKKIKIFIIFYIFFLLFSFAGCKPSIANNKLNKRDGVENLYAKKFSYTNYENYIEVCINTTGSHEYVWYLYRDEKSSIPEHKSSDKNRTVQYIKIPVQKIISLSSENIVFLDALDSLEKLKAIDLAKNNSSKKVKELVKNGAVKQVGEGRDIDIEKLYSIKPDIIFIPWTGGDYDSSGLLLSREFPVAVTAGWLESHPLGRAEWLVFLSLFLDMEEEGKNIFNKTTLRYNQLKESAASNIDKPSVFINMLIGDSWNMPAGGSYAAIMFEDAGAYYPWAKIKKAGSLFFDFEEIYTTAGNADIWLLNTSGIKTKKDILTKDKRYSLFKAFQNNTVYNNDLMDRGGGNPYWDEGVVYPDRILSDLIKIFHSDNYITDNDIKNEFFYFRHVE